MDDCDKRGTRGQGERSSTRPSPWTTTTRQWRPPTPPTPRTPRRSRPCSSSNGRSFGSRSWRYFRSSSGKPPLCGAGDGARPMMPRRLQPPPRTTTTECTRACRRAERNRLRRPRRMVQVRPGASALACRQGAPTTISPSCRRLISGTWSRLFPPCHPSSGAPPRQYHAFDRRRPGARRVQAVLFARLSLASCLVLDV